MVILDSILKGAYELADSDRDALILAVTHYLYTGIEPELTGYLKAMFTMVRPNLDNSVRKSQAGRSGGSTSKAKTAPTDSASEAKTDSASEAKTDSASEAKTDSASEAKTDSASEAKTDSASEAKGEAKGTGREQELEEKKDPYGSKEKRPRFRPPTAEELRAYAQARCPTLDCDRFLDFYASNGWRVGKNPMKDWRAAARRAAKEWCKMEMSGDGFDFSAYGG